MKQRNLQQLLLDLSKIILFETYRTEWKYRTSAEDEIWVLSGFNFDWWNEAKQGWIWTKLRQVKSPYFLWFTMHRWVKMNDAA